MTAIYDGLNDASTRCEHAMEVQAVYDEERQPAFVAPSIVAVCLEDELVDRLRVFHPAAAVISRSDRLMGHTIGNDAVLVFANPLGDSGRCLEALIDLRLACPHALIVLYVRLQSSVVPAILRLSENGIRDVVLFRTDDTRARFFEFADRAHANPLTAAVLRRLQESLARLPTALFLATTRLFESPTGFRTVDDLANAAHCTRRSLYRQFAGAHIRSPRLLVVAARVVRAAALLSQPGRTIRDVSRMLGYSKPEFLGLQFRALTGLRLRDFRDACRLTELPELIATGVLSAPAGGH